ncbi:hypothetical protein HAZT_HAZT000565 [Hyalella azteca]|uniref:LITAF domain-containing protein n=1 Tax=Hyalella azteca TaxID=294128 RepID=A0A6A0GS32_HYAAZ|nr:hypothetical protein HAZT_HAZT000565 [Hyalella azteca]
MGFSGQPQGYPAQPQGYPPQPQGYPPQAYPPQQQTVYVQQPQGASVHVVQPTSTTTTAYVIPAAAVGTCPACRVSRDLDERVHVLWNFPGDLSLPLRLYLLLDDDGTPLQ